VLGQAKTLPNSGIFSPTTRVALANYIFSLPPPGANPSHGRIEARVSQFLREHRKEYA